VNDALGEVIGANVIVKGTTISGIIIETLLCFFKECLGIIFPKSYLCE